MEKYWVEGLFVTRKGLAKARKAGRIAQSDIEPFCMSFWTNSEEEALKAAAEKLNGGQWTEGPHVTKTSEEQRMRSMGAPELPGLSLPVKKNGRKKQPSAYKKTAAKAGIPATAGARKQR